MANHKVTTKEIGRELDCDFAPGKGNDPDDHIDRFYFHIRVKITDQDLSQLDPLSILREVDPEGDWKQVIPTEKWTGLFYGRYKKTSGQDETERQREQRLSEVRKKLMAKLRNELATHSRGANDTAEHGVYVMITRACLYTPEDMDIT